MEILDYIAVNALRVKLFGDGADPDTMKKLSPEPWIKGFTTNPTLMKQFGVTITYEDFGQQVLECVLGKPVSFEVFSDDPKTIIKQAERIGSWGDNVYVKIPIMNTQGIFLGPVIGELQKLGLKLNITAVFTIAQVEALVQHIQPNMPMIVSVFAGRIADTGRNPLINMRHIRDLLKQQAPQVELLWASCREIYNIRQANQLGCDIITVTNDILKKVPLLGKDLHQYSLETVEAFYKDAITAGLVLDTEQRPSPKRGLR